MLTHGGLFLFYTNRTKLYLMKEKILSTLPVTIGVVLGHLVGSGWDIPSSLVFGIIFGVGYPLANHVIGSLLK